ncbi:hypothetical protein ACIOC1_08880 [Streptomyces sp. NPDC088197]|uniref:hypothetical protein n=1 Tax=Streptomyces sp. NPDC088197 TaxID=3365840 RepID=UPI00380CE50B
MADREDEGTAPQEEPARPPLDEDAAWAALIAGYDDEPEPGSVAWPDSENVTETASGPTTSGTGQRPGDRSADGSGAGSGRASGNSPADGSADAEKDGEKDDEGEAGTGTKADAGRPALPGSSRSIVVHPVIQGPRDYELADDDEDAHYVPPEPPPLPDADVTTKFAWIAVLGGPLLMLGFVLFQVELTWWAILLGVGGFLGGFTTLVARMRTGEDDDDLPGGGAVV